MKTLQFSISMIAAAIILSACGGSESSPAPNIVSDAPPPPPPVESGFSSITLNNISGSRGVVLQGTPGSGFGTSLAGGETANGGIARDVNGDTFRDILVGAPSGDDGSVEIFFNTGGAFSAIPDIILTPPRNNDAASSPRFGQSLVVADLNGTGPNDIAIGAPGTDANGEGSGRTYIVFGDANPAVPLTFGEDGFFLNGPNGQPGAVFDGDAADGEDVGPSTGFSLFLEQTRTGFVTDFESVVITSPGFDTERIISTPEQNPSNNGGLATTLNGSLNPPVEAPNAIGRNLQTVDFLVEQGTGRRGGTNGITAFASSPSGAESFTGAGGFEQLTALANADYFDVFVSSNTPNIINAGIVNLSINSGELPPSPSNRGVPNVFGLIGGNDNDNVGSDAIYFDVTGDGISDVIFGAPGEDLDGEDAGAIYIVEGGPPPLGIDVPQTLISDIDFSSGSGEVNGFNIIRIGGAAAGERLGESLLGLGVFDGVENNLVVGTGNGSAYIIEGGSVGDLANLNLTDPGETRVILLDGDADGPVTFLNLGDFDNQGGNDMAIGIPSSDAVFILQSE